VICVRGAGTLGPVPLSEGGGSITLVDMPTDEVLSPRRGSSWPVLIATHKNHTHTICHYEP